MHQHALVRAVALAIAGTAAGQATAGTVNYNAFNHSRSAPNVLVSGGNGTDGWLSTADDGGSFGNGHSYGNGPATQGRADRGARVQWLGTDPRSSVGSGGFGYAQDDNRAWQTLNWTATLGGFADSVTISRIDSANRYGGTLLADGTTFQFADIDTARGAWHDGISTGWKHDTDIGFFRSAVTQLVTLNISSLLASGEANLTPAYGFTVFRGLSTGRTASYSHHGPWHNGLTAAQALEFGGSNPGEPVGTRRTPANPLAGGQDATSLPASDWILDDVYNNNATFLAEAGVTYTIFLGGFQGGGWTDTRNDYQLVIAGSPNPVPLPAAAWLLASGLAGLASFGRRRTGALRSHR